MTAVLPDAAARDRITTALDETLFVEAGAGSGKTKSLVDRVGALLDAGLAMHAIAAITFTEKAAAELRDRIRRELERQVAGASEDAVRQRYRTALDEVDAAAISTLHAFAQRILTEHAIEAGLPPNVEVLDEVSSQIEFEQRWLRFRDRLLEDTALERPLLLGLAGGVRIDDIRALAVAFQANWDLVADPGRLPWGELEPPAIDPAEILARLDAVLARRGECCRDDDLLLAHLDGTVAPFAQFLRGAADEYEALQALDGAPGLCPNKGRQENWDDKAAVMADLKEIAAAKDALLDAVKYACVRRIAVEVAAFTLQAAQERRTSGRLEFHDLLVVARDLLRGPNGTAVRRRLRDRYQRLLLDEFQDTDPIQIDLAVLIAAPDAAAANSSWDSIDVDSGRLFFVGDPKQSIYRFRRADIQLFLQAGKAFGDPPVALTTNFRTTPPVIAWINHVFGALITAHEGSQPAYQPLDPAPTRTPPPDGCPVVLLGTVEHPYGMKADDVREREADDVADAVLTALTWKVSGRDAQNREVWRDAQRKDVTILLPARTSLAALEKALDDRGIPYRAETSSLVYSTREVRELMAAARALADPTDELALVTALRSPLFGCGDDDLLEYRGAGGSWTYLGDRRPEGLDDGHPVVEAMAYLAGLHAQLAWLTPSELLARLATDRRLFELGYAQGRPRDLWRRLRFVIDQARAWSEAEGGTLRHYLEWARMQASESTRVSETVLPETDDDSVRILTIHGSKGLEFPITIVSGMTSKASGRSSRVEVAFPPTGPLGIRVTSSITTPEYETFKPIDEQMDFHERLRLLYVACTRAKDHLVVSLHRAARRNPPKDPRNQTNAELIASVIDGAPAQQPLAAAPLPLRDSGDVAAADDLPDVQTWQAALAEALATSARRRSVGASDLELAAADLDAEAAAGADKGGRDLELPPWQKGRYGSAIGRAVHAVLQTVNLATGEGLAEAAAAQAAAEGVLGREEDIRRLAAHALSAPVIQQALQCRRWRETYVATPMGNRTLEGYIDLLFRADDGLVVVDYKTASSAADLDGRVEGYRAQGGAYAVAVEQATGEPVSRVVFVFLTRDGVHERDLPELDGAKAAVRHAVAALA